MPPVPVSASPPFDRDALLARLFGDVTLAAAMAALFADECPRLLADVRSAMAAGDAHAVERAAHALKSSVGNFHAASAVQAAERLEQLGRRGDVAGAREVLPDLEQALSALLPALRGLA